MDVDSDKKQVFGTEVGHTMRVRQAEEELKAALHEKRLGFGVRQAGCETPAPQTDFRNAASPGETRGIGWAIKQMFCGSKVRRAGWNGKGMYVVYQHGYMEGIPINRNTAQATGIREGTICQFRPYLMMKMADDTFVPWLAAQPDLLAFDWEIAL